MKERRMKNAGSSVDWWLVFFNAEQAERTEKINSVFYIILENVMPNLVRHLILGSPYETLNQVQGDIMSSSVDSVFSVATGYMRC